MKKNFLVALAFLSGILFSSCEVEFSPNDDWKEVPVVYCVLDQDDDTSYVRVQRCFMGEGNQYSFATNTDSINYPQGSISVIMEEWAKYTDDAGHTYRSGNAPKRSFSFSYQLMPKDDGDFYSANQPVFACPTAGILDSTCIYRIRVVKNATADTIATAETTLISGDMLLTNPNSVTLFQFSGTSGSKKCDIRWSAMEDARQYQPVVRFFYRDFIVDQTVVPYDTIIRPHYIDIPCNSVKSNMRNPFYSTQLDQNYFLSTVKANIHDTCNKNVIDTVQIFITCCNEPLAAYLYSNNPAGSLNQDPFLYTNVEGGLGVVASRRRHISFRIESPGPSVSNYKKSLHDLGVGF